MRARAKTARYVTAFMRAILALSLGIAGCTAAPSFRSTLPEQIETGEKTIAIIGDLQQTPALIRFMRRRENTRDAQQVLIDDLRSRVDELSALVVVGDLVYTGQSSRDWRHFDTLMAGIGARVPILPAIGNHDYPCALVLWCRTAHMAAGMRTRFPWLEPGEPYAVDAGPLLLLFIDSESRLREQAHWLQRRLDAAAGTYSAALVFFHRPPYSNSVETSARGDVAVQETLVPILRNSEVPATVFNGHIHGFEHLQIDDVHFFTTAGGGGPRVAMPGPADAAASSTRPVASDRYTGAECHLDGSRMVRPFNYVLLKATRMQLQLDVMGICSPEERVRLFYSTTIAMTIATTDAAGLTAR